MTSFNACLPLARSRRDGPISRPTTAPVRAARAAAAALLASLVTTLLSAGAIAQSTAWPVRPVRIVVPFAPGGNTDAIARISAERLAGAFGQPFVVDNRAGASGAIAAEYVARANPDGYTYCMCTLSQMGPVPLTQKVGYDPMRDLTGVANLGANPFVIAVSATVPATTLREFIDHLRARPGALNYGSGGTGNLTHLVGALFLDRVGAKMTHVPYKGGAPALADLISGQVQMYAASPSEVIPHLKAGRIRLLGVSGERRSAQLPDVPAIAEVVAGFRAVTWNGLVAPAAAPAAILDRVNAEIQKALADPAFVERLSRLGVDPAPGSRAEFNAAIRAEHAMWRDLIRGAGIQVE